MQTDPLSVTLDEIRLKAEELDIDLYWLYARFSGWYQKEYLSLYKNYIQSTSIELSPRDDAAKLKGRPLENIGFYFFKNGGIVTKIEEIKEHGRWQVDGRGPLNKSNLIVCVGKKWCQRSGHQLFMEAKNHNSPMTGDEFSSHHRRMGEHECNVGACLSTAGYAISRGMGIASSIHRNTWANTYHLLFTIEALYEVATGKRAPLEIFQDVLGFATNNMYANNKDLQQRYCKDYCLSLAESEYNRLFSGQT